MKLKYDSSEVDRSKSGDFVPPKPGLYRLKISEIKVEDIEGGEKRLVIVSRMMDNDSEGHGKGYGFWDRITLNKASAWKLDQYLQAALGIDTENKAKGTFDTDALLNKEIMGRVKHDTWDGEYSPKLGSVFPAVESDGDPDDEDPDEGDGDTGTGDEDEYEDTTPAASGDDEDDLDELGSDADDGDDDAIARLVELAGECDLNPDEYDTWAELAEAIQEENAEEPEPEPEPTPPPSKKAAAKKAGAPAAKAAPKKAQYEDMEIDDLRAEAENRGLAVKGTKSALIARLRTNDADPFSDD